MNIGLVCNELLPGPVGGIGTFTAELARGLAELGHGIHIAGIDHSIKSTICEKVSSNLTMHRLDGGRGRWSGYLNRATLFWLVRRLAVEGNIDLVEVPDFEGWCAGWLRLPIPVVVRLHGSATYFANEMHAPLPRSTKLLECLGIRRADHVVSVSRYTADRTAEILGLRLPPSVIYNSVVLPDVTRAKSDYKSHDLVCYSGTLVRKKGVFALAKAWPLIKLRRPNAKLMMIGKDGRDEGRACTELIREFVGCHADSIEFAGHLPKPTMEGLLISADVAVYPSYSEAFALAPMESMSLRVPTIYTTRASGSELIRHGIDGWLCDPDKTEKLANQIATLLENESARQRLGEAGRRRISEGFPYAAALGKNVEFYKECLLPIDNSATWAAADSSVSRFPKPI